VAPSPHCVALALDQDDAVHLVYRDADEVPQYATNASGDWVSGPIGGTSAVANCTVTVAPDGVVHTIFSTDALAVTHGHLTSDGDWVFEEVATGEVETTDVSFAIDSTNTLHVAYSDDGGVHYATTVADVWESDEVDAGQTAHLALQGDLPRIIYQGDPRAFYAELVADEWVLTELPWDAIGPDLTFASDGQAHAAFGDAGTGNVVWARSSGGGWSSEPVQPTEGTEPIGRILMTTDDEPLFLVAQEAGDGAASTLYFVERAPVDGVDDDCDGRVR
jgi:hypothetical protein